MCQLDAAASETDIDVRCQKNLYLKITPLQCFHIILPRLYCVVHFCPYACPLSLSLSFTHLLTNAHTNCSILHTSTTSSRILLPPTTHPLTHTSLIRTHTLSRFTMHIDC